MKSLIKKILCIAPAATFVLLQSSTKTFAKDVTVANGDTLSKIAKENGTTVEEILRRNNISDKNLIL